VDPAATGGLRDLAAFVSGAEPTIEALRALVLCEHPEIQAVLRMMPTAPRGDLSHELRADTTPLVPRSYVQVVEE
jgi:hypothetical protein